MEELMQVIRIHEHGSRDKLQIDSLPVPKVQTDEILIKVKTAALNHLDIWVREGIPGVPLPLIMGSDAAGIVETVGSEAASNFSFSKGDEVLTTPIRSCGHCEFCMQGKDNLCRDFHIPGESIQGVQAEYIMVPAAYVLPKPKNLSWPEAAALPLAAMTAYHMLMPKAHLKSGEWILIYGASSGIGSMAIQIAKALGAKVITTAGNEEKIQAAEQLGADYVLNYRTQSIGKTVREITGGQGVDVVFEHTGAQTWKDSLRALNKGGRLVTCGATTGPIVKIDLRAIFIKHQQIIGSTMGTRQDMVGILELVKADKLKPVVDKVFPFTEIKNAHQYLEDGRQFGKIALEF